MKHRSTILPVVAALTAVGILGGCGAGKAPAGTRTFQITLTDLTNTAANSGQPFSPPVFVTHDSSVTVWRNGEKASLGIQNIAEAGNRTVLVDTLTPLLGGRVRSLATPLSSPLLPGNAVTVTVTVDAEHPFLSSAWMLGRTNDGFSGLSELNLYQQEGTKTYELLGFDAGTERNSEKIGLLGALGGGNARDPEDGVIQFHEGITGRGDAPLSWNWNNGAIPANQNPVARVTITPVENP